MLQMRTGLWSWKWFKRGDDPHIYVTSNNFMDGHGFDSLFSSLTYHLCSGMVVKFYGFMVNSSWFLIWSSVQLER